MKTGIIVLAAGSSSRMGQSKQMLDIGGEALLARTVKAAVDAQLGPIVVVVGSNAHAHKKLITGLPVDIVHNEAWEKGMGHSLKTALHHLIGKHSTLQAVVVLVCDQPLLTPKNITNLVKKFEESKKPIVASRYSNMPGVPVLFEKEYFSKLMGLPDDQGAKKIVLQNPADVSEVDFQGGEIDLDTFEDYSAFKKR